MWTRTQGAFAIIEGPAGEVWRVPKEALPTSLKEPAQVCVSFTTPQEQSEDYMQLTRHLLEEMLNGDEHVTKKIS
jgi:hypothetical protein